MIAVLSALDGCIVPSGEIAASKDDAATPDGAMATELRNVAPADVDAGADVAPAGPSCESILDPKARAACAACLANPPPGDGGIETCELVDVAGSLGPTSCCLYHSSDGAGSCEAIFTYDRMAFVGSCPPVQ